MQCQVKRCFLHIVVVELAVVVLRQNSAVTAVNVTDLQFLTQRNAMRQKGGCLQQYFFDN